MFAGVAGERFFSKPSRSRPPAQHFVRGCVMSVRNEWRVHNGRTREEEIEWATDWVLGHDLPMVGFVIIKDGLPCEWQHNKPRANNLQAGTIALGMNNGGRFMVIKTFYGNKWAEVK